jgi:hypothetical protein
MDLTSITAIPWLHRQSPELGRKLWLTYLGWLVINNG